MSSDLAAEAGLPTNDSLTAGRYRNPPFEV